MSPSVFPLRGRRHGGPPLVVRGEPERNVLRSESTGGLYIGQTSDLVRRVAQHNDPSDHLTLHTKRRKGPWILIHSEAFENRSGAMQREHALKSGQGRAWVRAHLLLEVEESG